MATDREATPLRHRHDQGWISTASADPDMPALVLGEQLRGDESSHSPAHALETPPFVPFSGHGPSTQISQSLDQIDGHYAQLFGGSSESDPWLLRHCRFDKLGLRRFLKVHFRTAGGVPTRDKIPAHFMISKNNVCKGAMAETRISGEKDFRTELARLVPPECGPRLVQLFLTHVFPILPVLSRSQLGLTQTQGTPDIHCLAAIPTHLLAAIYASTLPYALNDDHLDLLYAYEKPSLAKVWRIVYELICEEIHTPHLSLLQAALLYVHKGFEDDQRYASSDTPFIWSFIGSVVGLAHSLGLHLECGLFGIPAQEKRLRRRLWWAVYVEDKFMSLLMGRPPYIHQDEWDVTELQDSDFDVQYSFQSEISSSSTHIPFRHMTRLALIVESIQQSLWSLKASQILAEDLPASLQAAKPLFDRLKAWRASISVPELFPSDQDTNSQSVPASAFTAYNVLVIYIWRALLRPTVMSSPPPQIIDPHEPLQDPGNFLENFRWDFSNIPGGELYFGENVIQTSPVVRELYQAAQTCAESFVDFVSHLSYTNFAEFWFSLQAPSAENAIRAKRTLDR
ncbi:hypothetical protein VE03_03996 [Pseudogymnoascus sp. 23342-1-I1]|nr:hypothetical protein VE03_03996 [Pseudogymnoascus sp. 23342-1-I1]